ncbi:Rqc2 family fibronectin-binding protein [Roseiflexus castenholzii]|uniref:Rqc2 family fibronectin-binding protein n=1 Tax=Roseiflexus castenholzii TaxID=120962 RepID=UPI003C7B9D9C
MYFDALTLAAVVDELRATIVGGRVQRVLLPGALSVALEIYTGRRCYLLLSAHPQFARVQLSPVRISRGTDATPPLLLLLRKYVNRGRITAVEQPDLERVLLLSIAKRPFSRNSDHTADLDDDDTPPEDTAPEEETLRCELIVEIMEQRSNIVLVGDDNIILAAARHVTPRMSRRPVLPREPYELPPPQIKHDPRQATAAELRAAIPDGQPDLARALVSAYRGLSPLAAREAVYRVMGRTLVPTGPDLPWDALADALCALWHAPWSPHLVVDERGPIAFAPYEITHLAEARPYASMSAALDAYYAARERLTAHQQRRDALREQLHDTRERLERQRSALHAELQRAADFERLRWEGEMIFAFLHTLTPGQEHLDVEGRTITLAPHKSPVESAQERFRAYDKAKSALTGVPERLRAVELRLAGLDETLALLDVAERFEEIEAIAREAEAEGYLGPASPERTRKRQARPMPPLRLESSDGFTIYIGRTAQQNEQVTFRLGAPDDLWLHARGAPGAHVIIKSGGREIPERTIEEAAALAAYYSALRSSLSVDVEIARRRHVRKVRGGPAGLVTYRAERSVRVAPRPPW